MKHIDVEGIAEAERTFDEMVRDYPKQTVAAGLRKAAKPFVSRVKEAGPTPEFSKLAGVKVYTKGREPLIAAGQFGGRNKKARSRMSMYFIEYWRNHGTLSNRSASYHFKNARKPISAKWKGGIKATDDLTKAWEASKAQVISAVPAEMRKAGERFIKRLQSKSTK